MCANQRVWYLESRETSSLALLKTVSAQPEYVVKNGRRTAVILPIEEDDELLQDLDDLAVIARRKNEPTIPLAEVKHRLKSNGAIRR